MILSSLYVLTHLILTTTPPGGLFYIPQFYRCETHTGKWANKSKVTQPQWESWDLNPVHVVSKKILPSLYVIIITLYKLFLKFWGYYNLDPSQARKWHPTTMSALHSCPSVLELWAPFLGCNLDGASPHPTLFTMMPGLQLRDRSSAFGVSKAGKSLNLSVPRFCYFKMEVSPSGTTEWW